MKKIAAILVLAVCSSTVAMAQSNFAMTYSMGFATGDLGDFIGQASFRGMSMDYRYSVQPNIGQAVCCKAA